jgi:hypothetical protein
MDIEILHIEECPNWRETGEAVARVLAELGAADTPVRFTLLSSREQAEAVPFAGSPTVLIDGVDAFPSDGATSELACRVYRVGDHFAGAPSIGDLRMALARALEVG